MWKCKHCQAEFDYSQQSARANHSRWCDKNPKRAETIVSVAIGINRSFDEKLGVFKDFEVSCELCKITFLVNEREKQFPSKAKYFCSRRCANTKTPSQWHLDRRSLHKICFDNHKKECVICGEDKIVAVHHLNENSSDNRPLT